jgi:hypothetical protein
MNRSQKIKLYLLINRTSNFITIALFRFRFTTTGDENSKNPAIQHIAASTYRTLTSLTAPNLPSKRPFETLTKLLKDHLDPQASEIAEQHKLLLRIQHEWGIHSKIRGRFEDVDEPAKTNKDTTSAVERSMSADLSHSSS